MDQRKLAPGGESFSQDFSANASLAGWTIPGTAQVTGGALVITPTLGAELLTDPGLEAWSSASDLTNYTESVGGSCSIAQEGTVKRSGSYAAKLTVDSGGNGLYFTQQITIPSRNWLRMSVFARTTTGLFNFRFSDSASNNLSASSIVASNGWAEYVTAIRLQFSNPNYGVKRDSGTNGKTCYFDDLSFKQVVFSTMGIYRKVTGRAYRVMVQPATCLSWGLPFGVIAVCDDPSNPANFVYAYHDGVSVIRLVKVIPSTTLDLVYLTNATYDAGKKIEIRRDGNTYRLFYGGVQQGTDQVITETAIQAGQYCGIFSADSLTTIKSFEYQAS